MSDQASSLRKKVSDRDEIESADGAATVSMFSGDGGGRVIAITSGKGGVGKTTISVNLAIALQSKGKRVLLIDADIGMANVDLMLGRVSYRNMLDLLEDGVEVSDIVISGLHGVNYISGSNGIARALELKRNEQKILHRKLATCGELADIILIDTGAGLGRNVMDFIIAAEEILIVATNDPPSISDAFAVIKSCSSLNDKKNISLIVNRVDDEREAQEVTTKLQETTQKLLNMPTFECAGYIFEDRAVRESIRRQVPLIIDNPDSPAARCIDQLADHLLTGKAMTFTRGWRGFLKRLFRSK